MKYSICFIMVMGCFGQLYTSEEKVTNKSKVVLQLLSKNGIKLEQYLNSGSFQINKDKIGSVAGNNEEFTRLITESNFKGHINHARDIFKRYLLLHGYDEPKVLPQDLSVRESLVASCNSVALPVKKYYPRDPVMRAFDSFHDECGYPTSSYFDRLIKHMDGNHDFEIAWYLRNSWKS